MEYAELTLKDLPISKLDEFMFDTVGVNLSNVISSYLHNISIGEDVEIKNVSSFSQLFDGGGIGNVLFKKIKIGVDIDEVMFLMSFSRVNGEIEINFPFVESINNFDCVGWKGISDTLMEWIKIFEIPRIVLESSATITPLMEWKLNTTVEDVSEFILEITKFWDKSE